jgi:outer membrane protein assembly factor BamB
MLALAPALALVLQAAAPGDWPQWRGPRLTGASSETGLPVRWSTSENVAWKLDLPSHAAATPVTAGQAIFLTVPEGDSVSLWSIDLAKGVAVWTRPLGPAAGHANRKHNMSSPSPATDGQHVYAMTGSGVVKGFDVSGRELWSRDFQKEYGAFGLNWGYASSPLLYDGALFVEVLHGMRTSAASYVVRLDAATGQTRWKVDRPTPAVNESPDAYTTPTLAKVGERTEIVVTGGDVVTGHDPATGKELWRATVLNPQHDPNYRIVASPVAADDLVIAPSRVRPLVALRAGGQGDVSVSHRLWSFDQGPDVPTPAIDGDLLYVVTDKGILWCLESRTGRVRYGPQRLHPGTYSASPLVADGRVYVTSEDGITSVVRAGPAFELLAENALDDFTLASPVATHGRLLLRTARSLYCLSAAAKAAQAGVR